MQLLRALEREFTSVIDILPFRAPEGNCNTYVTIPNIFHNFSRKVKTIPCSPTSTLFYP